MRKIKEGIVFSNDIKRILEGYNAIDFDYQKKGFILPGNNLIENLRKDFKKDVEKIFETVTILEEEEMLGYLYSSISDVYGRYPHHIAW